jgi:DNA-binding MarR family transcriptional regulator
MIKQQSDKYNSIQELIKAYGEFEANHGGGDMEAFAHYVLQSSSHEKSIEKDGFPTLGLNPIINEIMPIRGSLGMVVRRLYRYTLIYSKKAMEEIGLNNLEDFNYLISLWTLVNPTKSELINWNVSEFSSGIEVIKRLIKNELIVEMADEQDKRSKRLRITESGKAKLNACFEYMPQLTEIAFGKINDEQVKALLTALYPLEKWHWEHLSTVKDLPWTELIAHFQLEDVKSYPWEDTMTN